jgi:type IV pilus assembly protein PilY1
MRSKLLIVVYASAMALLSQRSQAQTAYSEDFTGAATANQWYFFNGACLTAGSAAAPTSPGQIPACTSIKSSYYGENLVGGQNGVSGSAQTLPDPAGSGALRFTNGAPGGYHQNGAIVSSDAFDSGKGVQITFNTVTYRGDSGGAGKDGADGISFYLMDGSQPAGIGAWGGSLGYTCSNTNSPYDGINGAYVGLGIDEYGNFLNGANLMPGYAGTNAATADNTALGYGYHPGRIGMRGAGSVSWAALNAAYGANPGSSSLPYYPSTLSAAQQQAAVQQTCVSGSLWNYGSPLVPTQVTSVALADYAPIPNAYKELSGVQIAAESAMKRGDAKPILYKLRITQDGLLSLSYSINGGAYQSVISKQSIAASNGPMPSSFRFGFAGSTGGSTNIHEIMCFKAAPADQSGSSASVNEKQAAKVEAGTQAYFAFYNPNDWTGRLTANGLIDTSGVVSVAPLANWDAECALSGLGAGETCPTTGASGPGAAQAPASRVMLTWSGTAGMSFEWASLSSAQQSTLDAGDVTPITSDRLNYLRGSRTNEVNTSGVGLFRARNGVLGDIVDSSPTWVGPPSSPYTATWKDRLYPTAAAPENSGTQSYLQFISAAQTRLNVVYAGANDGFLHGIRAGSFDTNGNFVDNSSTPNDGKEVLAYMPGAVLNTIHNASDSGLDYANTQYGHNFFVDGSPGTGDLFYAGAWHTWLVGGLGAGGAALYALDVTDPSAGNFKEANAANLVMGEWTPATLSCANVTNCGTSLGNTYGTPQIRRLHNGMWGVIVGNGLGSSTGDAGIYVMTVDPATGNVVSWYLSTGTAGSNGIAYVAPADLDGDHVTDYVYAGDLLGNLWRFDLTSNDPAKWKAGAAPLFKSASGQPITSKPVVASTPDASGTPRLVIALGTGEKSPLTNTSAVTYAGGSQDLYGVWDWNLSVWNALSTAQYLSLTTGGTGLSAPYVLGKSNLQVQTFTVQPATGVRDGTGNVVCWSGSTACGSSNNKFGWYADLRGSAEQIVYNPVLYQGAFIVNSIVPANNLPTSCTNASDVGYTYVISVTTGGTFPSAFPPYSDISAAGIRTDATGSSSVVTTAEGTTNLVYQTIPGIPGAQQITLPSNIKAKRLTWVELR